MASAVDTDTKPKRSLLHDLRKDRELLSMLIPGLLVVLIFSYIPYYGITIAFQRYNVAKGIFAGQQWVGLLYFEYFLSDPYLWRIVRNTLVLGALTTLLVFPAPILLALLFNEARSRALKRVSQTISYMPYFVSVVVIIGIVRQLLSMNGFVNEILFSITGEKILFMAEKAWFRPLYISTSIWQQTGFGSILYLAAIAGINPELYESANIDGAGRFRQIRHITIPSISSTIIILFIFSIGAILSTDYMKIIIMYNPRTYEVADVVGTYVLRNGIGLGAGVGAQANTSPNYSYGTAIGLLNAVSSLIFVIAANYTAKRFSETSLW